MYLGLGFLIFFVIFIINHYFFSFTFLCSDDIEYILDANCVLHTKLYVINVISVLFTNIIIIIKNNSFTFSWRLMTVQIIHHQSRNFMLCSRLLQQLQI